jgi:hypothetical protein
LKFDKHGFQINPGGFLINPGGFSGKLFQECFFVTVSIPLRKQESGNALLF